MKISKEITRTDRIFSPAEVCSYLRFSKSTLFSWERQGLIPKPERNDHFTGNDQRTYSQKDMAAIARKKYKVMQARAKAKHDDQWLELFYRVEFFFDPFQALNHLEPLAKQGILSDETLQILAGEAFCRPRSEKMRKKLLELIALNG